ncbi:hypothetical protein PHLCEN_2v9008 [Hermanssonia centrifuga]|uniref:Uncharacterized protein n=1 Tax=Hermanssonia centrifuga TaxID=98765 RepID=A0A2R6NS74_9APHY|nr:hypothetical protein PHLCEN_2v9008 [Hermanssonia centrifuga]
MARTTNSRVRQNRRLPFLFLLTKNHRFASQTCAVAVGRLDRALNASRRVHQSTIRRLKFPCFRSEGPPNPVDVAQRMPRDGPWTLEMVQEFYRQDSYVTDVPLRTFVYGARKEGDHSKAIGEIAPNLKGIKLETLRRAAKRSPTCRYDYA